MIIMAIESSCDETSIAIIKDGKEILSNIISSQIDIHAKYGGVVPEIASRQHILTINPILEESLNQANTSKDEIDAIAVTNAPGLQGSLLVGITTAKTIAWLWNKPLIPVNHLEGHIYSALLENDVKPPMITLLVSGGHTEIIYFEDYGNYKLIGKTKDDAVGEAFDKVARLLNLPYPGGPYIDKLAKEGNPKSFDFPRAMKNTYDFSFSGLKTSVLYKIKELKESNIEIPVNHIAASFTQAVVDTLVDKTIKSAKEMKTDKIVITGGVAANSFLRAKMQLVCDKNKFKLFLPSMSLCTDNAAMIGCAAYHKYIRDDYDKNWLDIQAVSRQPIAK